MSNIFPEELIQMDKLPANSKRSIIGLIKYPTNKEDIKIYLLLKFQSNTWLVQPDNYPFTNDEQVINWKYCDEILHE